jgi:hypothetical protein
MNPQLVALCLSAFLLVPNITQVPEIENSTRLENISFSEPFLVGKAVDISEKFYAKMDSRFSKANSSQLISMDVELRRSRVRQITNKAARFFKQVTSY